MVFIFFSSFVCSSSLLLSVPREGCDCDCGTSLVCSFIFFWYVWKHGFTSYIYPVQFYATSIVGVIILILYWTD